MAITNRKKKDEIDPLKIADDLLELDRLKAKLSYYKEHELEQRIKCAEYLTKDKTTGTYSYKIPGFKVTVKKKQTISFDWKSLLDNDDYDDFTPEEQSCIRFKPELIDSKFKNFEPDDLPNLAGYVTIKPSAPEISLIKILDTEE